MTGALLTTLSAHPAEPGTDAAPETDPGVNGGPSAATGEDMLPGTAAWLGAAPAAAVARFTLPELCVSSHITTVDETSSKRR
jgi:hypothetical protein